VFETAFVIGLKAIADAVTNHHGMTPQGKVDKKAEWIFNLESTNQSSYRNGCFSVTAIQELAVATDPEMKRRAFSHSSW